MSAAGPRRKEVLTPEGVPLTFSVAEAGDRLSAFAVDVLVVGAGAALVLGAAALASWGDDESLVWVPAVLAVFLLRNFYFALFELRWQGATPGKRLLRIRVVDARGGPLRPESVLARNLTREVESFWPVLALLAPDAFGLERGPLVSVLALAWLLGFGLLPLLNRDRLRVGDLAAGTLVVREPEAVLLDDLAGGRTEEPEDSGPFTRGQLSLYGVYELQVLEDVLRADDRAAQRAVARRIQAKIGWEGETLRPREFLRAFYRAQRARLERDLLLGRARERKQRGRLLPGPRRPDSGDGPGVS